jgi:phage terminase small subunit
MPLTPKQIRFVDEYLIDLNATQAAIRAGYSEKTAYAVGAENLRKPQIAKLLADRQSDRAERTEITQDYVLTNTREVLERCMDRRKFNPKGAIGALSLLAKHVNLGGPAVNLNINFDDLTDAQLQHIASGGSLASLPR